MCCALVLLALCGGVGVCITRAAGSYVGNSVGMFIGVYPWSQEFVRLVCLLFGPAGILLLVPWLDFAWKGAMAILGRLFFCTWEAVRCHPGCSSLQGGLAEDGGGDGVDGGLSSFPSRRFDVLSLFFFSGDTGEDIGGYSSRLNEKSGRFSSTTASGGFFSLLGISSSGEPGPLVIEAPDPLFAGKVMASGHLDWPIRSVLKKHVGLPDVLLMVPLKLGGPGVSCKGVDVFCFSSRATFVSLEM